MPASRLLCVPLVLALAVPARADVVACPSGVPAGVVCLSGDVSDTSGGGPLVSGKVYHLANVNVPVGETLTVESGAILKFQSNAAFEVRGTLALGAATLTSVLDDSAGGDTNADGLSVGQRGDWDGLVFYALSGASVADGATVRFATVGATLFGADPTFLNLTVEECQISAFDLNGNSHPVVTGCSFTDNGFAVRDVPFAGIPLFAGNAASGNDTGDYMLISADDMVANMTIGPQNSLGSEPFVACRTLTVPPGLTLTVDPGTVIKFGLGPGGTGCGFMELDVQGTLLADGLSLTSLPDDSVAGDTNKDGSLTVPAPGDWGGVRFKTGSDASRLENALVAYAGRGIFPPFLAPAVDLTLADVLLDGVRVEDGADAGLRLNANSFPTVRNCDFARNAGIAVERASLQAPAGFTNNSAADNGRDYVELLSAGPELLGGAAVIQAANALNADGVFGVANTITVLGSGFLELGGGVALKFAVPGNFRLTVDGTLVCATGPVTFTTITDDEVVGDSNEDGAATAPGAGDWVGLVFSNSADASVLDQVVVRWAGQATATTAAVALTAADVALTGATVEWSETAALTLSSNSYPTVSGCTFTQNDRAVDGVPIGAVPQFTNNVATGNAAGDFLRVTQGDVSAAPGPAPAPGFGCPFEIGPLNALLPDQVFVFAVDIDVPVGDCLAILPGTIVKWEGVRELDVDGYVEVGGIGGTVVFTSIDDDAIGGDTRKDGFTEGQPGDWRQIHVSDDGSTLDDVLVRFAGNTLVPSIQLVGADTQMTDVRVEDGDGAALWLSKTSFPVVDGCSFDRNRFAVDDASIRALPGFSNNSASQNLLGDFIRITDGAVSSALFVSTTQSLDGRPFVVRDDLDVLAGATLTVDGNVVFKFEGPTLRTANVAGTLLLLGSAAVPVVFTSFFDDIAGDTNKDGGASAPAPGDWKGFEFTSASDASQFIGGRVRFAEGPAVRLSNADVQILDSSIEQSSGAGLRLSGNSRPDLRRTSITDGLGRAVDFAPLDALPGFADNTASGNATGDYIHVSNAFLSGAVQVTRYNALNDSGVFGVDAGVTLTAGTALTLGQGTIFKWIGVGRALTVSGGELVLDGTGFEPVVLTSIDDDAVGGDTRKDGAALQPAPGDWASLTVSSGADPTSRIENAVLRYGGSTSAAARLQSPDLVARALRADFSATDGIAASTHSGDAVGWVAFTCGGDGIDLTGGSFDVVHATVAGCAGAGVRKGAGHAGALRNAIAFGNAGGELAGFVPGQVFDSNAGAALAGLDGNIAADPQFIDSVGGDLGLAPSSPCVDAGDLAVGIASVKDHREAPRVLDHDLDGQAGADMGAFEVAPYELAFGGAPRVGTQMSFTTTGPPGFAVYYLGFLDGATYQPPFGHTLYGTLGSGALLGIAPVGTPLVLPISSALSAGTAFGVQALARPSGSAGPGAPGGVVAGSGSAGGSAALRGALTLFPSTGALTPVYRGVVVP